MPYGVDTSPFRELAKQLSQLPERIPTDAQQIEGPLFAYLRAVKCLLDLDRAIMEKCVSRQTKRRYVRHFLPVYDEAARRALQLFERDVRDGYPEAATNLVELLYAARDSQIGAELVALDIALEESAANDDPSDDLDTATTVTNSVKEQIEKHTKWPWVKSVLHAINEVISIVRGVVA